MNYKHIHSCNFYFITAAPNAPPTALFGSSTDSTTIALSWNPPPPENQNGMIRHYTINVTELNSGESFILISINTDIVLSSLHPFYVYEIRIAAVSIATGPSAFLRVHTEEDGQLPFQIIYVKIAHS